jgi:ketosteroid isomerase-like protein
VSAEENTRLVQTAYEAFGQGDMATFAELMTGDIEWVDPGDPDDDPNAGTFKGKEAVLGWFGRLTSTLDYTTFEPSSSPRTTRSDERAAGVPNRCLGIRFESVRGLI